MDAKNRFHRKNNVPNVIKNMYCIGKKRNAIRESKIVKFKLGNYVYVAGLPIHLSARMYAVDKRGVIKRKK